VGLVSGRVSEFDSVECPKEWKKTLLDTGVFTDLMSSVDLSNLMKVSGSSGGKKE